MATEGLRQRRVDSAVPSEMESKANSDGPRPVSKDGPKKLTPKEAMRVVALAVYFLGSCVL